MKTFKEFADFISENVIIEMSIARFLYNEFKDIYDNKIILLPKTKKNIEKTIVALLNLQDENSADLRQAVEININSSSKAKQFYLKHKDVIDKIIDLLNDKIDIQKV